MDIRDFFEKNPCVGVALSGGVDSSFLLYLASKYAKVVKAYFVQSVFQPVWEQNAASSFCDKLGISLRILTVDILSEENVAANPENRCYFCKKKILQTIWQAVREDDIPILLDGTNASDSAGDRPGMKVLREEHVFSPLRDYGYTKKMIREGAKAAGLSTADLPSYACLATRIPTDTYIVEEDLQRVEAGENILFHHGFSDFRIRIFHGAARIQLKESEMMIFLQQRETIRKELSCWFSAIFLDTQSRAE